MTALVDMTVREVLALDGGVVPAKLPAELTNKRFGKLDTNDLRTIDLHLNEVLEAQSRVSVIMEQIAEFLVEAGADTLSQAGDQVRARQLATTMDAAVGLLEKLGGSVESK
jgi:hypothetical protein